MQNFLQHVHVLDKLVVEWQALIILRFCIGAGLVFACHDLRRGMSMIISNHIHAQQLFGIVSFRGVDMQAARDKLDDVFSLDLPLRLSKVKDRVICARMICVSLALSDKHVKNHSDTPDIRLARACFSLGAMDLWRYKNMVNSINFILCRLIISNVNQLHDGDICDPDLDTSIINMQPVSYNDVLWTQVLVD